MGLVLALPPLDRGGAKSLLKQAGVARSVTEHKLEQSADAGPRQLACAARAAPSASPLADPRVRSVRQTLPRAPYDDDRQSWTKSEMERGVSALEALGDAYFPDGDYRAALKNYQRAFDFSGGRRLSSRATSGQGRARPRSIAESQPTPTSGSIFHSKRRCQARGQYRPAAHAADSDPLVKLANCRHRTTFRTSARFRNRFQRRRPDPCDPAVVGTGSSVVVSVR